MSRMRVVMAGLGMTAFLTLSAATSAAALPKFQPDFRDPRGAPYGQDATHTIKCGNPYPYPISGGFSFGHYYGNPEQPRQVPAANRPVGQRKWRLHEFNYDKGGFDLPRVYVLCAEANPDFELRTKGVPVLPGQAASATARCKPSRQAVSAGWQVSGFNPMGGAEVLINESRRIGDHRWRVSGVNIGAGPGILNVLLNCSKRVPELREVSRLGHATSENATFIELKCRRGKIAYTSGFQAPVNAAAGTGAYSYGLFPTRYGRAWGISMAPFGGPTEVDYTAFAYCGSDRIKRR